jgi:Prokaryotic N-terminal methylation motif
VKRARAFTLIETMIALAIALAIVTAGISAVMNINTLVVDTRKRAEAWDEAKRLGEFLVSSLQSAGGGIIRPAAAIALEDNCAARDGLPACMGSDRVTIMRSIPGRPACPVTQVGASVVLQGVIDGSGVCCFDTGTDPVTGMALGASTFEGVQALLVGDNGTVISIYLHNRAGGCMVNAPPGQGAGVLGSDIATAAPGTLVAVEAQTLYLDVATHTLRRWVDVAPADGALVGSETTSLNDITYDFQVALAYDTNPEDGRIADGPSTLDEWLGNAGGDSALGAAGAFQQTSEEQLRAVEVGVAVGVRAQRANNVVTLLNGPPVQIPGIYLAQTQARAFLRNLNLFVQ